MRMQLKVFTISLALSSLLAAGNRAQTPTGKTAEKAPPATHVMAVPADLKWTDGPPALPAGTKMAVLEGDPMKKGSFTLRLQMPGNYRIPPHWHPADEHVTVLSGSLHMGMGDKMDSAMSMALPVGVFAMMPAKSHHFAYATEPTTIQLHGIGPWGITYVNPADDPRKKSSR